MSSKALHLQRDRLLPFGGWCRQGGLATTAMVAALWSAMASPLQAGQTSSAFLVSVSLRPAGALDTGVCRSTESEAVPPAAVTVVCDTGAGSTPSSPGSGVPQPAYGGNYRFLTYIDGKEVPGSVDSYAGVGTTTAFRVVSAGGRAYVEMTVGW